MIALLFGALAGSAVPKAVDGDVFGTDTARTGRGSDVPFPALENTTPALTAIAPASRSFEIARAPADRDVLAERLAIATLAPVFVSLRAPTLGIVVPSCHPLLRWCIAHATATSPA